MEKIFNSKMPSIARNKKSAIPQCNFIFYGYFFSCQRTTHSFNILRDNDSTSFPCPLSQNRTR